MDKQPLSLDEYQDILLDAIVTKDNKHALRILQENHYTNEANYLVFKKHIARFVINFGTSEIIEECYRQKILTLKLKIEKNVSAVEFAFRAGNRPIINFFMSKGVSLHKEENDYYFLKLLSLNTMNGDKCYEYLSQAGYINVEETEQKYSFLDRVILCRNVCLLLKVVEDGKFKTHFTIEEVEKELSFEKNSPFTIKSIELLKSQLEKKYLEDNIKPQSNKNKVKL